VRDTQSNPYENKSWIEGVIKKGVKKTKMCNSFSPHEAEDVIKNGVKHTEYGDWLDGDERLDDIIENGVKETNPVDVMKFFDNKMEDALKNGVRTSHPRQYVGEKMINKVIDKGVIETHDDAHNHKDRIDGVIKNGVKETKISPTHTEYGDWLDGDERLDDIIENGEKINGTYAGGQRQSEKCKSVVEYGTKNPTD
jgi:hypothetical protein